jgi:hypothetical protein
MGLFNALARMVQGKPVFQAGDQKTNASPEQQQLAGAHAEHAGVGMQPVAQIALAGPKILPQMYIEEVRCQTPGHEMDCEVTIKNKSQETLELDRVEALGRAIELNVYLQPHQVYELRLYHGPRPTNTSNAECRVFYKKANSDAFCSLHHIEFNKLPDNTFAVSRIRFMPPVRDV